MRVAREGVRAPDVRGIRARIAVAAPVVVLAGLALRFGVPGSAGDVAGGVLYALLVVLGVAFVAPRWRAPVAGLVGLAICTAVELLQLTGVPARLAGEVPVVALALGTGFAVLDLVAYVAGCALGVVVARLLARSRVPARA